MKKIVALLMAGLLIISMTACGSGGAAGGSKPVEEAKSEDLLKDSKGFGESPALENTDDRYMPEITEVDIDGKIYKTKAISLQKPIYGNYVRNFLVQGEKFYLNMAGSDPGTIAEDGFYSFIRKGDVLAEQKQEELGSYFGSSLEHPSIDNQGNIYYVNWKEIVKWTPQGFIKALELPQKGAFAVNPDGSSGILEYCMASDEIKIGSDGKITVSESEEPIDSVGMKVEIKDGKFTGEAAPIENYLKEDFDMGNKLFRTQKHIYSLLFKENSSYLRQMDFDGKETFFIGPDVIKENGMTFVRGVAELDNKIFLIGDGVLILDEKGGFLKYIMLDQFSAKTKGSDGSYLMKMQDSDEGYRPSSFDFAYQSNDGRIYGALRIEKNEEKDEMQDEELVIVELFTYSGQ